MAPSKTFNLAGLKVSVAVIPDASLRERFMAARGDYVQASVNILGYAAALAAYRDGQEWLDELMRYLEGNRDFLIDYVRRHLPGVSMVAPEGTYLAWLDCRSAGPAAADPFTFFLERAKVALNDGALFGAGGPGLRAPQLRHAPRAPDRRARADAARPRRLRPSGPTGWTRPRARPFTRAGGSFFPRMWPGRPSSDDMNP